MDTYIKGAIVERVGACVQLITAAAAHASVHITANEQAGVVALNYARGTPTPNASKVRRTIHIVAG